MTQPFRPTKKDILQAWMETKKVNYVPCIYDFAERVLRLKESST